MLKAEIIAIGDELLNGDIVDTNSAFIAKEFNNIGVYLQSTTHIHDDEEVIVLKIREALSRSEIVVVTGGLGPTNDDRTKEALAKIFNSNLVFKPEIYEHIKQLFAKRNRFMSDTNQEQALFPDNAKLIFNEIGTAPGIHYTTSPKNHLFAIPGVPYEAKYMVKNYIIPTLKELESHFIQSIDIQTFNIGESHLYSLISNLPDIEKLTTVAFLPKNSGVVIRLTAQGEIQREVEANLNEALELLKRDISSHIRHIGSEKTVKRVIDKLLENSQQISIAESCTGGLVATMITNYPGVSKILSESYVTYSNESKFRILGVNPRTLSINGAVSSECVSEMADGLLAITKADVVGAISGIAGPDGGTPIKPVGTIFISTAIRNGSKIVREYNFTGDREAIRERAANAFFMQILEIL